TASWTCWRSLSCTTTSMPAHSSSRPSSAWGGSAMDSICPECFWHRVVVDDAGRWEDWLCDPTAKLSHGCCVAVRMQGDFMLVGTITNKRPVDFRRAVIAFHDA